MATRKKTKRQTMIYKALHRKLTIEQKKTTKNWVSTQVLQTGSRSCSTRHVTVKGHTHYL